MVITGNEKMCYYSLEKTSSIGTYFFTGTGVGQHLVGEDTLSVASDLYISVNNVPLSANETPTVDIVVTINGMDNSATPVALAGTATIPKRAPIGSLCKVVPSIAGKKFTSINSPTHTSPGIVATAGGVRNDAFDVVSVPLASTFVLWKWLDDLTIVGISTHQAISYNFKSIDHYKRIRGERTFSGGSRKCYYNEGATLIAGRDVVLRVDICVDGSPLASEQYYLTKARVGAGVVFPEGDAVATSDVSGSFERIMVVPSTFSPLP